MNLWFLQHSNMWSCENQLINKSSVKRRLRRRITRKGRSENCYCLQIMDYSIIWWLERVCIWNGRCMELALKPALKNSGGLLKINPSIPFSHFTSTFTPLPLSPPICPSIPIPLSYTFLPNDVPFPHLLFHQTPSLPSISNFFLPTLPLFPFSATLPSISFPINYILYLPPPFPSLIP